MITITMAILSLIPDADFAVNNDHYDGIIWYDKRPLPSRLAVSAEVARLEADFAAKAYQRQRAAAYPPMADYLDGIVKNDQAQIAKYIADCLAVKAKYPKTSSA